MEVLLATIHAQYITTQFFFVLTLKFWHLFLKKILFHHKKEEKRKEITEQYL